jgi:hypothetical protein
VLCELCFRHIYANPLLSDGDYTLINSCVAAPSTTFELTTFERIFYQNEADTPSINFDAVTKTSLLSVKASHEFLDPMHHSVAKVQERSLNPFTAHLPSTSRM